MSISWSGEKNGGEKMKKVLFSLSMFTVFMFFGFSTVSAEETENQKDRQFNDQQTDFGRLQKWESC